jgi:hypothetical protein
MQKGKNSVIIACTLELLNTLKEFSSKADQNEGYHLAKRLLMYDADFRERFIEKYGQTAYNEAVLHYSKTNLQQREERKLKEEERKIREEAKLKIEELKAKAYAKQTESVVEEKEQIKEQKQKKAEKQEIRQLEAEIESSKKLIQNTEKHIEEGIEIPDYVKKGYESAKAKLPELEEKLKELKT